MVLNNGQYYSQASTEDREEFKSWLKGLLHEGPVTITFTKVDGSERVMQCSLKSDLLPPIVVAVEEGVELPVKKERKVNPEVVAVFDLEKQDWRSVKYETIKEVKFAIGA
jgi:uncharacterized protein YccT (UPF0319 family)